MILKKRMNCIKATWQTGCFEKMDENPVHTIPDQHLLYIKTDVLLKTFVKIILVAKWLLRHSSMYVPQTTPTTFAFSCVCILLLRVYLDQSMVGIRIQHLLPLISHTRSFDKWSVFGPKTKTFAYSIFNICN